MRFKSLSIKWWDVPVRGLELYSHFGPGVLGQHQRNGVDGGVAGVHLELVSREKTLDLAIARVDERRVRDQALRTNKSVRRRYAKILVLTGKIRTPYWMSAFDARR
jgi:hypothetical protein